MSSPHEWFCGYMCAAVVLLWLPPVDVHSKILDGLYDATSADTDVSNSNDSDCRVDISDRSGELDDSDANENSIHMNGSIQTNKLPRTSYV